MLDSTLESADNGSFQAFVNSYLREIDQGVWHASDDWELRTGLRFKRREPLVIELLLSRQRVSLAIGVHYRSLVGRHTVTEAFQKKESDLHWQPINRLSVMLVLIHEIYRDDQLPVNQHMELIARLIESNQVMQRYLSARHNDPALSDASFIGSEQSLLYGHWFHPTPKSRQGLLDWQHTNYTPELCGRFALHFFAADRKLIKQNTITEKPVEEIILDLVRQSEVKSLLNTAYRYINQEKVLIPTHPIQAQWLIHQPCIKRLIAQGRLENLGPMGPKFTATSSVRTLYNEMSPYMYKFSLPVKITNSIRLTRHHELEASVAIARLMKKIRFDQKFPQFKIIQDPAYLTLNIEGIKNSGFEVILRENPFQVTPKNRQTPHLVQSVAALVQAPFPPEQDSRLKLQIHRLTREHQLSLREASLNWFENFWHCAIEPNLRLYDKYGIALEAHQQNSLLDVSQGLPTQYYYRDNQGYYLSRSHLPQILTLEPEIAKLPELVFDDAMIRKRFIYYLFVNLLFSVINRFGLDELINESELVALSCKKLAQLKPQSGSNVQRLIKDVLEQQLLPCKGNLLTRANDIDELQADQEMAVYTSMDNPFYHSNNFIYPLTTKAVAREASRDTA